MQTKVLKDCYSLCRCRRPLSMALRPISVTPDGGRRAQNNAPVLQSSDRVGKDSGDELGSWRTTDASTQESSSAATSCTSWFSPAARPPPSRSQISHAFLSQADWCAIPAVARRELGLLPVIKTLETGARV